MEEDERLNQITERVIGAAIAVYRALDPGLPESAYEKGQRLSRYSALCPYPLLTAVGRPAPRSPR